MKFDPTRFSNAVGRLREGLQRCESEPRDEQLRDGLIQRFEFTYELAHRTLRRYLKETAPSPEEFDRTPFPDLIRAGAAQGLLRAGWPAWRRFREMRSRSSHTYDDKIGSEVVAVIPEFLEEAAFLLAELQKRPR